MELNREQIIKALECFHQRILDTNLAEKITEAEMMAIIDALALIKELTEENKAWQEQLISQEEKTGKAYYDLACEVEDLRAENERLRAEGEWLPQFEGARIVKCSVCGYEYCDLIECGNYCGNCGAKMKGERREG